MTDVRLGAYAAFSDRRGPVSSTSPLGHAENTGMSDGFVGTCQRCGTSVHEEQSHVIVVNVGGGRTFYHAGCVAPGERDLGEDRISTARPPA
jgi:hypothetical protein